MIVYIVTREWSGKPGTTVVDRVYKDKQKAQEYCSKRTTMKYYDIDGGFWIYRAKAWELEDTSV